MSMSTPALGIQGCPLSWEGDATPERVAACILHQVVATSTSHQRQTLPWSPFQAGCVPVFPS